MQNYPEIGIITMSQNSATHPYTRLDFLNRSCTGGLAALAINSIGIKVEDLEKGNESVSSKMVEDGKDREAKLNEIIQLIQSEKEALCSKITVLEKENQVASSRIAELVEEKAASTRIAELEEENRAASSKVAKLEEENQAASSKIADLEEEYEAALSKIAHLNEENQELEEENLEASSKIDELEEVKQAASCKIDELEKKNRDASRKIKELEKEKDVAASTIALLEKELGTMVEKFEKYKHVQLGKKKDLRTKFQDFKRHTKAEREKEKEAAMSKIAMLENELETNEVRIYTQAVRALKQIQDEDKEPREKVKELTTSVQKLTRERNHWETLAKQLNAKESETTELVVARKEMIRVFLNLGNFNMDVGVKEFGVIDSSPFRNACKRKFSSQVFEEKAMELCSIWQKAVENPKWDPFRTITSNGKVQGLVIDSEDRKLQQLKNDWGYEVYAAVVTALIETKEYTTNGRTMTHQLWNFEEGRKATLKEAISVMGEKMNEAKIKDTGFIKVDQLDPRTEGTNLVVKVLNTDVVVDKRQNPRPSYMDSNPQISRVAESLVGDDTGTILFTARNEQVDLMKPGSILILYGAKIQMYRGFMRLAVEHPEQIITAEPVEFFVDEDEDCNKSLLEYKVFQKYRH